MKDLLILLAHLLTTAAKLLGPGGARAVVADSLLMKHRLLVAVSQPVPHSEGCRDYSTFDTFEISQPAQEAKVSTAVFIR
jgi:hypothetical protein